jgi:hypothetical protein
MGLELSMLSETSWTQKDKKPKFSLICGNSVNFTEEQSLKTEKGRG